jgi:outer membrane immunogenic protein
MRKIFIVAATAATLLIAGPEASSAADMAVRAPVIASPTWSWTGFYIGAHVGAGWGTTETTLTGLNAIPGLLPAPVAFSLPFSQNSTSGFLGGVQAGYNWQLGWAVLGVQGDFAGLNVKGTAPCIVILSCTTNNDWLATVSGRFGGVVAERALVYVKGGGAWMNATHSVNLPNIAGLGLGIPIAGQALTTTESTAFGWLVGLGSEFMITPNWTAFIEYNYIEFDRKSEANNINLASLGVVGVPPNTVNADFKNKLSIAKVGVNYKFDWGGSRY